MIDDLIVAFLLNVGCFCYCKDVPAGFAIAAAKSLSISPVSIAN